MKLYGALAAAALFALAACGRDGPAAVPPSQAADQGEAPPEIPLMGPERHVLALGDSLFTGYGLDRGQGYPERLEAALRSKGVNARIANAGVSGDTSAGGRQRLAFALDGQKAKPDLVIVSLGGNDMLRGLPPAQTRANLGAILAELQRRQIPVVLMGMLSPPNYGEAYRREFDGLYPALAKQYRAGLVPFFLQPVFGRPDLTQPDRIHPTAQGIEAMVAATADAVAKALPKEAAPAPRR